MQKAREAKKTRLEADTDMEYELAVTQKEIMTAEYEYKIPLKMKQSEEDKAKTQNAWKAHSSETQQLNLHRGKAYEMILGQCS